MSKKPATENKTGAYVGWAIIIGFLAWGFWVGKKGYDEYSTTHAQGVAAANKFWEYNNTKRGPLLAEAISSFTKANQPRRPEVKWAWTLEGFKVSVIQMKPFRDWCFEEGWSSGFHSVMDQKPK